jgi:hypothetical protein
VISWIVASHDDAILHRDLLKTLFPRPDEEVLIERDAPSIAVAYNRGTARAQYPLKVYVHHDVRLLDADRLRDLLLSTCTQDRGMVGVIGSITPVWPWWNALQRTGSVLDTALGPLRFGPGGCPVAILDGLLLATVQDVIWDESYEGWHGYDHDQCVTQLAAGRVNWCLPAYGPDLLLHNRISSTSPTDTALIQGWDQAASRFHQKWSPSATNS